MTISELHDFSARLNRLRIDMMLACSGEDGARAEYVDGSIVPLLIDAEECLSRARNLKD